MTEPVAAPRDYTFTPRWKEELVCSGPEGELVVELTMGTLRVYFPSERAWRAQAPAWAQPLRAEILAALEQWCRSQGIPLTVDDTAWVDARRGE